MSSDELALKNAALMCELGDLKKRVKDLQDENDGWRDDLEKDLAAECGCVLLKKDSDWSNFVDILFSNGYSVDIIPVSRIQLKIVIKNNLES